ncbi:hypothetical protein SEPCBS119000_004462 [Sporothrix epigloea]|uniref:Suppressor protein srp40 n=1 Tax=Sporothrix epigloea TaxID=1892477 RepID=A0ABP0DV57_9PEZI
MPAPPSAAPSPVKPTSTRTAAAISRGPPAPSAPLAAADPGYTRLHITPLDADLLSVVIPASAQTNTRNVSFHNLQTFPEKRYGFVDLPTDTAEKLRRKLNGAVLKGVKLRIESARQAPAEKAAAAEAAQVKMGKKKSIENDANLTPAEVQRKEEEKAARRDAKRLKKERSKKGKSQTAHEELLGVQLESGRQVKRGWTVPDAPEGGKKSGWSKDKKDKVKSKQKGERSEYTEGPECLFKTILPASKVPKARLSLSGRVVGGDVVETELDERALKRKRKEEKKAREVVVHEFANWTRIPTFLKSTTDNGTRNASLEYVQGKGWVDEATGNVVQPLKSTRPVAVTGLITKEAQLAKRAKLDAEAAARSTNSADAQDDTSTLSDSETSDSGSDTSSSDDSSLVAGEGNGNGNDNLEYVEGKGWVNEATGDVVQPLKSTRPVVTGLITKEAQLAKRAKLDAAAAARAKQLAEQQDEDDGMSSSSGSSSSSEEEDAGKPLPSAEPIKELSSPAHQRLTDTAGLTIQIPPPPSFGQMPSTPATKKAVHPLEALYKKEQVNGDSKKKAGAGAATAKSSEAGTPFRFFSGLDNDDLEEDGDAMDVVDSTNADDDTDTLQPPMTPFTRGDFEWRNVRSAAPTPDTAHPNRMKNFQWPTTGLGEEEEDGEDEEMDQQDAADTSRQKTDSAGAQPGEQDFQSWFWENRGELNRSWKRRRKMAAKDKRYHENRARAERAI